MDLLLLPLKSEHKRHRLGIDICIKQGYRADTNMKRKEKPNPGYRRRGSRGSIPSGRLLSVGDLYPKFSGIPDGGILDQTNKMHGLDVFFSDNLN